MRLKVALGYEMRGDSSSETICAHKPNPPGDVGNAQGEYICGFWGGDCTL